MYKHLIVEIRKRVSFHKRFIYNIHNRRPLMPGVLYFILVLSHIFCFIAVFDINTFTTGTWIPLNPMLEGMGSVALFIIPVQGS